MSLQSANHALWNNFTNTTNISGSHTDVDLLALDIIVLVYAIATISFYSIVLFAVLSDSTMPGALRIVLGNILATTIVIMAGIILYSVLLLPPLQNYNFEWLCRFLTMFFFMGDAARLVLLNVYALAVLIGIRHGVEKLKITPTIIVVIAAWLVTLGPHLTGFSSEIWKFTSNHEDGCGISMDGVGLVLLLLFNGGLYGLLSLAVTAIITVVEIIYVKKRIVKQDIRLLRIMVKFSIVLLVANTVTFVGQVTAQLGEGYFLPDLDAQTRIAFIYISHFVYLLSLIAMPVFVIIVFQTVRQRLLKMICCCFSPKQST